MKQRFLPALLVIAVANLGLLAGVALNRLGEPDATVTMTEREFGMGAASGRDSSRRLAISSDRWGPQPWLTPAKLAALGFETGAQPAPAESEFYARQPPRRAFVVLEYDGPALEPQVRDFRRREAARASQPDEVRRGERRAAVTGPVAVDAASLEQSLSRLISVDAGPDAAALRRVYPDRRKYMIVPAAIRIHVITDNGEKRVGGSVLLSTTSVVVPRAWRGVLDAIGRARTSYERYGPPRYAVTVSYGRRLEPWIVSVERIDTPPAPH